MAKTKIDSLQINDYGLMTSMARQALINGNFDIWQRGTSFTNPATATFIADRWKMGVSADGGTHPGIVFTKQPMTGFDFPSVYSFLTLTADGAGSSLGNNSVYEINQYIEHGTRYLCGAGRKVTVSFWARSSIASKTLGLKAIQYYGTGGSPTAQEVIAGTAVTLTGSFQKFTHTFTTNTLSGKTLGTANDDALRIFFCYQWGSTRNADYGGATGTALASGTIEIAQVQVCSGDVALPFQPKSYEEELRACLRYYQVINTQTLYKRYIMVAEGTADVYGTFLLPVHLRDTGASITGTVNGTRGTAYIIRKSIDASTNTSGTFSTSVRGNQVEMYIGSATATAGEIYTVLPLTTDFSLTYSAEL